MMSSPTHRGRRCPSRSARSARRTPRCWRRTRRRFSYTTISAGSPSSRYRATTSSRSTSRYESPYSTIDRSRQSDAARSPRGALRPCRAAASPSLEYDTSSPNALAVADVLLDHARRGGRWRSRPRGRPRTPATAAGGRRTARRRPAAGSSGSRSVSGSIRVASPPARITQGTSAAGKDDRAIEVEPEPGLGEPFGRHRRPQHRGILGVEEEEPAGAGADELAADARRCRARPGTTCRSSRSTCPASAAACTPSARSSAWRSRRSRRLRASP